jgi:hypothetical protein
MMMSLTGHSMPAPGMSSILSARVLGAHHLSGVYPRGGASFPGGWQISPFWNVTPPELN